MSRAPVTVLFSILLLMSFGLTQNVSADEVETAPSVCLNSVDQVDFTIFDLHSIAVIPLSETEVRILAQGGGLSPGSPGIPPDPRDQAIFIIDGGGIGNVDFSSLSDIGTSFGVTFTGLSPGTHTVVVCYIDRTNIGFISFTLVETLTHTDVFTFATGPVVDLCTGVDCSNLDDQCSQGTCDPSDGSCFPTPVNNFGICDDGDACTTDDFCLVGLCLGGPSIVCADDGNACTNDLGCDADTGLCIFEDVVCADDGLACTDDLGCDADTGLCIFEDVVCADDGNACTDDLGCDPDTGLCIFEDVPLFTPCDDGNACTTGETCLLGTCDLTSTPTDCSALADQCNAALCDSATGCFSEPVADGTQCDDEDPNTQNDICEAGVCSGVTPGGFSCGLGTTPNVITNECEPDVTQADLDSVEAQRDAILATLFEFLRVFGVI